MANRSPSDKSTERSGHGAGVLKRWGAQWLVATLVIVLLMGPYVANLTKDLTQYLGGWQKADLVWLAAAVALAAMACVALRQMLMRAARRVLVRLFDHVFVVALGAGLLTNLWFYNARAKGYHIGQFGVEMQTFWLALVGLAAYSFARPQTRLVRCCRQLCLIASPSLLLVGWRLIAMDTYAFRQDPLPPPAVEPAAFTGDSAAGSPVYLFVFDEWSYPRTYSDGRLRPGFPTLTRLSSRATVFHDAHSPAGHTPASMPRLLFQTSRPEMVDRGRVGFLRDGEFVPAHACESIFSAGTARGYRTFMSGILLPYGAWLGDQVDVCRSYCWYPQGGGIPARLAVHAFNAAFYMTDPWSTFVHIKLKTRLNDHHLLDLYADQDRDVLHVIRTQPRKTFAVFHCVFPHNPYILNPDGSYRGPDPEAWRRPDAAGYCRNLACMDRRLGLYIDAMQQVGRFDDALLIVTSDHTWRFDPDRPQAEIDPGVTHVPLIIKWPGQREPVAVHTRFENRELKTLIDAALDGEPLARVVDRLQGPVASDIAAGTIDGSPDAEHERAVAALPAASPGR